MMANLWTLGGPWIRYDSHCRHGGGTWFLVDDLFRLQDMLYPTAERPWCNCADLTTLVKVAADSVGGKPDPNDKDEEVLVSLVHLWVYMIRRGRIYPLNY